MRQKYKKPLETEYIELMDEGLEKEQAIGDREFSNMLGWMIQDRGFKKADVCERAEVDYRDLQRYLNGENSKQKPVIRLAMALEQSLENANRLLKAANQGLLDDLNRDTRIIKKHYNAIVEEFKEHRDNPVYVCESILNLNEELAKNGFTKLFESSKRGKSKGENSKYD